MLDTIAELSQHGVGNIQGILGNEVNPDAFGANQTHDLLDLFQQGWWCVVEQQMSFVKEKRQFGFG